MTALLPVRGRLLLCRTTVHASLQHSTAATSTQQQLRTSQLCSQLRPTQRPQIQHQLPRHLPIQLQQILPQPTRLPLIQRLPILRLQRPHQLPLLQRRPHLRLQRQQTLRLPILRLLHPLRPHLRPQPQLQQIQPQLSQP